MRQSVFLLGIVVFLAGTAGAQTRSDNGAAPISNESAIQSAPGDAAPVAGTVPQESSQEATPQLFAVAATDPSNSASSSGASSAASGSSAADAASASPQVSTNRPPEVQSVFASYNWEAYIGYTFLRFRLAPSFAKSTNGLNVSSQYFFHTGALGIDGEGVATFASVAGQTGKFWTGLGGVRYRFSAPRNLEVWVHGLVGGAKFLPQTALGGQTGFAYETGAGVDVGAFNHRLALRFAGDMVGTHFFSQFQYSPKISAGIVFKY